MKFLSTARFPNLEVVRRAWREYALEGGKLSPDVRPYVNRAWRRSRALGCDPQLHRAETLSSAATARLLTQRNELRRQLDPFLTALSRAAAPDRHAAILSDEYGHILQIAADEETSTDDAFPHAGALLSEATSGANGVGTALAEDAYVELVGPEHYMEGFHPFTCQGVPVHSPDGTITAVLSMSVRRLETADRVRDILFCASEAAECELLADWLAYSADSTQAPVLERLRQDIVQKLAIARLRLEQAAAQLSNGASASDPLDAAVEYARKFKRQAQMWRALATDESAIPEIERIDFTDLVADFMDLLQTEARVALVRLTWGCVARLAVLEAPQVLAKQVLAAFLSAIQESTAGALIEVNLFKEEKLGKLQLRAVNPDSCHARTYAATAPLVF